MIRTCRRMLEGLVLVAFLFFALSPLAAGARAEDAATTIPAVTRAQLEADWLTQARLRYVRLAAGANKVTPEDDAVGGCDGVIDGKWGFHTQLEQDPWWQVDLGDPTALGRLRLYNRCDGFESRAAHIQVLLSGDGQDFRLAYTHDGSSFRGQPDQKPLEITLQGQTARFIRLQLPGQVYFHLDEVVVLAEGSDTNVALHKPATQSSVSPWSVKHANAIQARARD